MNTVRTREIVKVVSIARVLTVSDMNMSRMLKHNSSLQSNFFVTHVLDKELIGIIKIYTKFDRS